MMRFGSIKRCGFALLLATATNAAYAGPGGTTLVPPQVSSVQIGDPISVGNDFTLTLDSGFIAEKSSFTSGVNFGDGGGESVSVGPLIVGGPVGQDQPWGVQHVYAVPGSYPLSQDSVNLKLTLCGNPCFNQDQVFGPQEFGNVTVVDSGLLGTINHPIEPWAVTPTPPKYFLRTPTAASGVRGDAGLTPLSTNLASLEPDVTGHPLWFDPGLASGYDFSIQPGSPNFASITLLSQADPYDLMIPGLGDFMIEGGEMWTFPNPGITSFELTGIDNPMGFTDTDLGFLFGLTFYGSSFDDVQNASFTVTPIVSHTPTPEPASIAILATGLAGAIALRRRNRAPRSTT